MRELRRRGETVALVLADQRMPGMTGVELLESARALYPKAKRALLTAYADTDAAIAAINQAQIDYYLQKPWDPPEERLFPTLDDLLDDWQADAALTDAEARVVGHRFSPESHDARDFLARNRVPYAWLDARPRPGGAAAARPRRRSPRTGCRPSSCATAACSRRRRRSSSPTGSASRPRPSSTSTTS